MPLLASLKLYTLLSDLERELQQTGFVTAMISYVKKLKLQSRQAGKKEDNTFFTSCLENSHAFPISPASSVSLTFTSSQEDDRYQKLPICCTRNWRGKGARSDCVFFQNEVVSSKKAEDAFGGKTVGKVLCLFQWKPRLRVGKKERYSLALIDILLPLKPEVGKTIRGKRICHLKNHGMFMVVRQHEGRGRQVVDISCFRHAAHVVPTDIWEKRIWVNNYTDLETYNNVFDSEAWEIDSKTEEDNSEVGE